MKKLFLTGFLLVFAGISLAEMPQIVNPPRPTRKFKWLLVIKHIEEQTQIPHTHYIYTNKFRILRERWAQNYIEFTTLYNLGDFQNCVDIGHGCDKFSATPEEATLILESWPPTEGFDTLALLLKAKAPEPAKRSDIFTASSKSKEVEPPKAKVLFTK